MYICKQSPVKINKRVIVSEVVLDKKWSFYLIFANFSFLMLLQLKLDVFFWNFEQFFLILNTLTWVDGSKLLSFFYKCFDLQ